LKRLFLGDTLILRNAGSIVGVVVLIPVLLHTTGWRVVVLDRLRLPIILLLLGTTGFVHRVAIQLAGPQRQHFGLHFPPSSRQQLLELIGRC
jgi:hypothetical protein